MKHGRVHERCAPQAHNAFTDAPEYLRHESGFWRLAYRAFNGMFVARLLLKPNVIHGLSHALPLIRYNPTRIESVLMNPVVNSGAMLQPVPDCVFMTANLCGGLNDCSH